MAQTSVNYPGQEGYRHFLYLNVDVVSQDTINNRTYVRIYSRMYKSGGNYRTYNLYGTPASLTYDGIQETASGITYDFNYGIGEFRGLMDIYRWINHNADGTKTANFQAYHNPQISPYLEQQSVSFNVTMPTIQRNATINLFTITPITDMSFTVNVGTDVTCDLFEISTDNGSTWMTAFAGDFTSKSYQFNNQPSDTTWLVKVRVRRKDSQIKTTSDAVSVTTLSQNNFMGFL